MCEVRQRRGALSFAYRVGAGSADVFTLDFYAYRERAHPERHLGWWRFDLPAGSGRAEARFDFSTIAAGSVTLDVAGASLPAADCWFNPEFAFDPLGDLELVFRDGTGRWHGEPVVLKYFDRDILREFYARHYTNRGYYPSEEQPFLHELHAYKLSVLRRLFDAYIPPTALVADVGCGRSLFAEFAVPFRVVSGDLNFESVRDRSREVPAHQWGVFDASALPFPDNCFDALFAGEVIEHVQDARATLREWSRVLKPGGIAIVTTPNRRRLVARVNGMELPYSPDHLSELSYGDLSGTLLTDSGFEFVDQHCIYLELWLQHLFAGTGRIEDHLQREGNVRRNLKLMRMLFPLGRLFPGASLALIVVARKRSPA